MRFVVDRIENDIAVLENIENNEIVNVSLDKLPTKTMEKDVILYDGKNYVVDIFEKSKRVNRIKDKMSKLKNIR